MERRNIAYTLILAVLSVAIVVVVVLILRKRAMLPIVTGPAQTRVVAAPTSTVPLKETRFERPWKPGDPIPTNDPAPDMGPLDAGMKVIP